MSQEFLDRMNGRFRGMLYWPELDALWAAVRANPEGWYVSLAGVEPEQRTMTATALHTFVQEVDALLRHEHDYDYCGIVFADDPEQPTMVKIHDPNRLGSSCGSSKSRTPPRWVLSRIQPALIVDEMPLPESRRRWWQKIFG